MRKVLSIGKQLGFKTVETGSRGLGWAYPLATDPANGAPVPGTKGSGSDKGVGLRFYSLLLIPLTLAAVFFYASPVGADDFDDSPPEWEFLLWGGQPSTALPNKMLIQVPAGAHPEERENGPDRASRDETSQLSKADSMSLESHETAESWSERLMKKFTPLLASSRDSSILLKPVIELQGDHSRAPFRALFLRNIPPLYVTPTLPGEGIWQSGGLPTGKDGIPTVYRTSYRPSVTYANAVVHMMVFDMKQLSVKLYIGSTEPGGSSKTATVEPQDKPRLLAITNALWKQKHSGEGGAIFRGTVLKKLAPGLATIVVYNDDSVDILEWNDGIPTSLVRDARQLRHLIVKDGKVVDSVIQGGRRADSEIGLGFLLSEEEPAPNPYWGGFAGLAPAPNYGEDWFIATRSAFGIRRDGNLVFAIGHHISTKDLAKALVLAGCERAIHGDANPHNVVGNLYYGNGDGEIVKKVKLSPEQKTYTLDRYDRSYTSDFFGFFLKREEGEQS
ncbi:MAG: hypothetical protein ACLP5H_15985 [Desulfomonilaceae bacterium]